MCTCAMAIRAVLQITSELFRQLLHVVKMRGSAAVKRRQRPADSIQWVVSSVVERRRLRIAR